MRLGKRERAKLQLVEHERRANLARSQRVTGGAIRTSMSDPWPVSGQKPDWAFNPRTARKIARG